MSKTKFSLNVFIYFFFNSKIWFEFQIKNQEQDQTTLKCIVKKCLNIYKT